MDSLNKHVQQISFRQCITFCEHRQLKGGSHTSNSLLLKAQSGQLFTFCSSLMAQLRAQSVYCDNSLDHNSLTRPSATLHMTGFFCSCNQGMGMMQPFNAEMAERNAALRKLKLLVGSGGLDLAKRHGFLKHVQHIFFGIASHSRMSAAERLTAPLPTRGGLFAVVTWEHNQYIVANLPYHNSVTRPSASLHVTRFFLQLQRRDATIMQRWRKVLRLTGTSSFWQVGCLEFQQGIAGMDSLNKHVQQISFRQCVTFCEHRQLKGWQPHFQRREAATIFHWLAAVAYIVYICIKQPRSQSISCSPNLEYPNSIFCKHDATTMTWWNVPPISGTWSFG